jgi:hypothetical protein
MSVPPGQYRETAVKVGYQAFQMVLLESSREIVRNDFKSR